MKKRIPSFLAGALTTALVCGLSLSALAANGLITIDVDPNVSILVNSEIFQPKNAQGEDVLLFNYGGTVYGPVRALAEAYGLEVDWDESSNMATVGTRATPPNDNETDINEPKLVIASDDGIEITIGNLVFIDRPGNGWDHIWFYSGSLSRDQVIAEWMSSDQDQLQSIMESAIRQFGIAIGNPWDEISFLVELDAQGNEKDVRFARCGISGNGTSLYCNLYQPPLEYKSSLY